MLLLLQWLLVWLSESESESAIALLEALLRLRTLTSSSTSSSSNASSTKLFPSFIARLETFLEFSPSFTSIPLPLPPFPVNGEFHFWEGVWDFAAFTGACFRGEE